MRKATVCWMSTVLCSALVGCGNNERLSTRPAAVAPPTANTQPAQASGPETPGQDKDYTRLLAEAEARIKQSPDGPMPYYRRCQYLMKLGRYEEGYQAAKTAMAKFTAAQDRLTWMLIDSIDLDSYRIDIHFNMGPDERQPPEMGITRPLSFRVWTKSQTPSLVRIIDYEMSYFDGKPATFAFCEMTPEMHLNYQTRGEEMTYGEIRETARKLIAELVKKND
jgi:hypothetical protein